MKPKLLVKRETQKPRTSTNFPELLNSGAAQKPKTWPSPWPSSSKIIPQSKTFLQQAKEQRKLTS